MSLSILELRDVELRLWREGELVHRSPGFALNQDGELLFGDAAVAQARVRPREVEHRYWSELSLDPLKSSFAGKRHFADLAHAHLLDIAAQSSESGDILVAVPSNFRREQLALLLGILKESPFRAVGLIDGAVATAADIAPAGQSTLLEFQLHQAVLTNVHNEAGEITRQEVTPLPGLGVLSNNERLASAIANAFIEQTRFDPRHTASVEQELFDRLPEILDNLGKEREIKTELGGYTARLDIDILAASLEDRLDRIRDTLAATQGTLLVEEQFAVLPGIESLADSAVFLSKETASQTIARHGDTLRQEEEALAFVTALPAGNQDATTPAPVAAVPEKPAPTQESATSDHVVSHVLFKHVAYAIGDSLDIGGSNSNADIKVSADAALSLRREQGQLNLVSDMSSITINGQPAVPGQILSRGDLIMLGGSGELFQLISVAGADGA